MTTTTRTIETGTEVIYHGDRANKGGTGRIVRKYSNSWADLFDVMLDDGRELCRIFQESVKSVYTDHGFVTREAYDRHCDKVMASIPTL